MKYVILALNVLKQHKGSMSPASLKIQEGIIDAIKEKLDANVVPTDAEKEQLRALLPQLNFPELKDELEKFIAR